MADSYAREHPASGRGVVVSCKSPRKNITSRRTSTCTKTIHIGCKIKDLNALAYAGKLTILLQTEGVQGPSGRKENMIN